MFVHIRAGLNETHQIIYVLENMSRFYLFEPALKDLDLLPPSFLTLTSLQNMASSNEGKAPCGCPQRTTIPPKLTDIPFAHMEKAMAKRYLKREVLQCTQSSTLGIRDWEVSLNTRPSRTIPMLMEKNWMSGRSTRQQAVPCMH